MPIIGDKPGEGWYRCVVCDYEVHLKEGEELEQCPICDCVQFEEIKKGS